MFLLAYTTVVGRHGFGIDTHIAPSQESESVQETRSDYKTSRPNPGTYFLKWPPVQ